MSTFGSGSSTLSSSSSSNNNGNNSGTNANPDYSVPQAGNDGISSLTWSPTSNLLVSTNWDSGVRCWECQSDAASQQVQAIPKAQVNHANSSPVLDSCFSADGSRVFTAGADNAVRLWSLGSHTGGATPPPQIGAHDAPVSAVRFLPSTSVVASGGWDSKLKFWDGRSPHALQTIDLPGKCYAMDCVGELLVVACADRRMLTYDVRGAPQPRQAMESQLKYQTRCVAAFPDRSGFAVGSIEGRVGIQYLTEIRKNDTFAFKCHRRDKTCYAVNAICFNRFGTFATAGADGTITFWDKDHKQRLKAVATTPNHTPASAAAFNAHSDLFAYASSYDWSKGSAFTAGPPHTPNEIFLHYTKEDEIKPKPKSRSRGKFP